MLLDSEANLISAYNFANGADAYFVVDKNGNGYLSGSISTSKSSLARTRGASGKSYSLADAREAAPELEDVGEARMTNGRADVAIDPALADSIDMRRPYEVFLTPRGDSNGLYVAQKGPQGFVVRESDGGRSTLTFSYRIVGKPFDENGARLAAAPPLLAPYGTILQHRGRRGPLPAPLSPEARLQLRLGTQGYAQALLTKRSLELQGASR
jgi:hypothetical protein